MTPPIAPIPDPSYPFQARRDQRLDTLRLTLRDRLLTRRRSDAPRKDDAWPLAYVGGDFTLVPLVPYRTANRYRAYPRRGGSWPTAGLGDCALRQNDYWGWDCDLEDHLGRMHTGVGATPRAAYRDAWRSIRTADWDTGRLLGQIARLEHERDQLRAECHEQRDRIDVLVCAVQDLGDEANRLIWARKRTLRVARRYRRAIATLRATVHDVRFMQRDDLASLPDA